MKQIVFYTPLQSSVIYSGDYEDIRIDADHDQNIDLWVLKKGNTQITVRYSGKNIKNFIIKRNVSSRIFEVEYTEKNGGLVLAQKSIREPRVMNGHADDFACRDSVDTITKNIAELAQVSKAKLNDASAKVIKCDNNSPETVKKIQGALSSLIVDKDLQACISGEKTPAIFPKKQKADLLYYGKKLELDLKKIGAAQEPQSDLISCNSSEDTSVLSAKYTENGNISFSIPKDYDNSKLLNESKPLLLHELLHRVGIEKDADVEKIVNICMFNMAISTTPSVGGGGFGDERQKIEKSSNVGSKEKIDAKSEVASAQEVKKINRAPSSSAADKGGGSEGINIAKEVSVAEVKQAVPSADKLAVNSVNMTDEGKAQAVADSQAQSAPVFAMADRAMGVMNTRALASDDSSSSSVSSSTRSSGDRYQVRHQGYESDSSSTKSSDKTDYSKMIYKPSRSGGNVVEEVDLTKRSAATAGSESTGRTTSANSRGIASTGSAATASTGDGSDEVAGNASSAGGFSSGSNSGGSGTFYADSGSSPTRKTNAGNRRGVASQNTGSVVETSREEVITFISNANYTQAKSKLRDQSFQQTLSNNQISIIYADGSDPIGASRGTTVFLDDGSRFIMQRRK